MKTFAALLVTLSLAFSPALANDTGAWFDPEQNGHGISLYQWADGVVFWWFTYDDDGNQLWLQSSVEEPSFDMTFDLFAPSASSFPTSDDAEVGEPVGVATFKDNFDDTREFNWVINSPNLTCKDLYGPVPPGPLDPRCRRADGTFDGNKVLDEGLGLEAEGSATFQRLTPQ